MYQTLVILSVTSLLTIITTIVTVRYTMLGRVLSQSAKDKLSEIEFKYGMLVASLVSFSGSLAGVVMAYSWAPEPPRRLDVLFISYFVSCTSINGLIVGASLIWIRALKLLREKRARLVLD